MNGYHVPMADGRFDSRDPLDPLERLAGAALAWRSFGVVLAAELAAAGIATSTVSRWRATARLRPLRRGAYAFGPEPTDRRTRWLQRAAAELGVAGCDAALTGAAAAMVWTLDGFDEPGPITVVVPRRRRAAGAQRRALLEPPEVVGGLRVTAIVDTLVDLGTVPARPRLRVDELVELALEDALRRHLVDIDTVAEQIATSPNNRTGAAALREVLDRRPEGAVPTESYLETRGIQVLRNGGLGEAERQVEVHDADGFVGRVDQRLGGVYIEYDGYAHHRDREIFVSDRRRWNRLAMAGCRLAVFSYDDVEGAPQTLVDTLRALARRSS